MKRQRPCPQYSFGMRAPMSSGSSQTACSFLSVASVSAFKRGAFCRSVPLFRGPSPSQALESSSRPAFRLACPTSTVSTSTTSVLAVAGCPNVEGPSKPIESAGSPFRVASSCHRRRPWAQLQQSQSMSIELIPDFFIRLHGHDLSRANHVHRADPGLGRRSPRLGVI